MKPLNILNSSALEIYGDQCRIQIKALESERGFAVSVILDLIDESITVFETRYDLNQFALMFERANKLAIEIDSRGSSVERASELANSILK